MSDRVRDEFVDRAVRVLLDAVARSGTPAAAAATVAAIRAELAEQIRVARDEEGNPALADGLARLLGRLVDETEGGGTRG